MGFGIYTKLNINGVYKDVFTCSCGKYNEKLERRCSNCGNTYFTRVYNGRENSKIEDVSFNIIKEDKSGFVAERYIDKYDYNSNDKLTLEHKGIIGKYYMIMDFKNRQFYFKDVKGVILPFTAGRVQYFLKRVDNSNSFISSFKTKEIQELLNSVEYLYRTNSGWGSYSFPNGLARFARYFNEYEPLQILANCGFDSYFIKNVVINRNDINLNKTKPNEILGMSKIAFKTLKDLKLSYKCIKHLNNLAQMGSDNIKYIYSKLNDECTGSKTESFFSQSENYINMINKFGYDNRRLINYLTRDVKLQQGIDDPIEALTLLKDTNQMCEDMEIRIKEKYPKSLKKDHDIAKLNYKVRYDEITDRKFKKLIADNKYKSLEFSNKEYSVITPKTPNDLVKEGDGLSHCVASYIKDVCNEKCKIYFIRNSKEKELPLLTVEVRNNRVLQVRGKCNRSANENERQFISQWSQIKNIELDY